MGKKDAYFVLVRLTTGCGKATGTHTQKADDSIERSESISSFFLMQVMLHVAVKTRHNEVIAQIKLCLCEVLQSNCRSTQKKRKKKKEKEQEKAKKKERTIDHHG
jgi:hypothetical protein